MIHAILDNPIAVREWRVLRRRSADWRIWVGLKWTLDPIVWGAPVVLTYALGPYGLWAVLALLGRLRLIPPGGLPLDPFFMLALVFWFYVVAISLVLGATSVSHEREQQTWDQLQATPLTGPEKALGLLWGRLGPIWISLALTAVFWSMSLPLQSAWLPPGTPPALTGRVLAVGTSVILGFSVLAGEIGLLSSARSQRTTMAVVMAVLRFTLSLIPFAFLGVVTGTLYIMFGRDWDGYPTPNGQPLLASGLLVGLLVFISVRLTVRDALRNALGMQ
jgi:ABC-type transport system involved in multi-copper enzyme maturation permease subunit